MTSVYDDFWPGQYFGAETGLHYNWNRYYDPDIGRYLSPDPIGLEGGLNLYAYVNNDPVNWVDPEGLNAGAITWGAGLVGTILIVIPEPSTTAAGTVMLLAAVATIPGDTPIDQANDGDNRSQCEKLETCATKYPNLKKCDLYRNKGYIYNSKQSVLSYIKIISGSNNIKVDKEVLSYKGPCAGKGYHYRVTGNGSHLGSITSCQCCEDTIRGPIKKDIWLAH